MNAATSTALTAAAYSNDPGTEASSTDASGNALGLIVMLVLGIPLLLILLAVMLLLLW